MKPTVSVIVPVYNVEKHLSKCLDSLVNQTLENMEIIVVNDSSPDNSQVIIDKYVENYPQVKSFVKPNGGIADVRNFGLSKVTGEYIGFLDSDDYTTPDMYEKMYKKAKENDAEVVVSNFNWVSSKETKLQKEGPYQGGKEMMVHLFATLWNKIYKTDFIKNTSIQFPTGNRYEDACFLYCLSPNVTRVSFVDEAFVSYVQHGTSITHTNNSQVKNMITVFHIIVDYFKENNFYDEYYSELEYLHIKFFLGNSFLRSSQIIDKQDRKDTVQLGWNLLNTEFPNWKTNHYLNDLGGMKNKYFKTVSNWNINLYAWLFHHFKKFEV
ncbi:glycosyltransferase [Anaerorhabdus sp.]|uniref:glycosyltransferase n=1 Tax=Anaerorhabdus sp. TaxID=1872524 RepID=UPI002FC64FC2